MLKIKDSAQTDEKEEPIDKRYCVKLNIQEHSCYQKQLQSGTYRRNREVAADHET